MRHNIPGIRPSQAYHQARKEFYELRLQEDIERRIATEEALSTGASFGPSALEIGMELENKEYERWKTWAEGEVTAIKQKSAAMYTGSIPNSEENALDMDEGEDTAAEEEISGQIPAKGQSAFGGAAIHP